MDLAPALEIDRLRVDYGAFTAVDELSLSIGPREIFGLVGPNGAGKTSTIRVIASLLEPTYGEVRILGHDLFEQPVRARAQLAYMPDLAPVIPNLKVWEFLDLYAHSHGLRGSDKADRIASCLRKVKLEDQRNTYGRALSRGMTQRVVLAKSLLHEPKLLLLDEPASGMDPLARRDLRLILQDLAAAGASVIVSSHILSELADMCTSVGIMHKGRLLKAGPVAAILDSLESEVALVRIETIESTDAVFAWLESHELVDEIRIEGARLDFRFRGGKREQAELLRDMVQREFGIVTFSTRESGIESVLMSLIGEEPGS